MPYTFPSLGIHFEPKTNLLVRPRVSVHSTAPMPDHADPTIVPSLSSSPSFETANNAPAQGVLQ